MGRRHFHNVRIRNNNKTSLSPSDPRQKEYRLLTNQVAGFLHRSSGLREYLWDAFRAEKVVLHDPPLRELIIDLVEQAETKPFLWLKGVVRAVHVQMEYVSFDLLKMPQDNEIIGEFFIDLIEQALDRLVEYPQLPFDLIRSCLSTYRENNYTYHYKIGERTIPGTKLKGRIDGSLSCLSHTRTLTISYRGKELYSTEYLQIDEIPSLFYRFFSSFSFEDGVLEIQRLTPRCAEYYLDLTRCTEIDPAYYQSGR